MEQSGMHLGSEVVELVYLEVKPVSRLFRDQSPNGGTDELSLATPVLSSPLVKLHLLKATLDPLIRQRKDDSAFRIQWTTSTSSTARAPLVAGDVFFGTNDCTVVDAEESRKQRQMLYLPQNNSILPELFPCHVRGFARRPSCRATYPSRVRVTESTLIRIMPARMVNDPHCTLWKDALTGELAKKPLPEVLQEEVLRNHNPDTIAHLTLRMENLITRSVRVGTTVDALERRRQGCQRRLAMRQIALSHCRWPRQQHSSDDVKHLTKTADTGDTFRETALLVHSPKHGAGKTLLVETIARRKLQCDVVYTISAGPLLAKYGIHADAALETIVHEIFIWSAVHRQRVCIILDHLDSFVSPALSGSSGVGDATVPVLNAFTSYLRKLSSSLSKRREVLFPSKNPMYNLIGTQGTVLEANICLVAIVTCPDDGWRSSTGGEASLSMGSTIFSVLAAGRYRIPSLSASTRLGAVQYALENSGLQLSLALTHQLPYLTASAVWAYGQSFCRIADLVKVEVEDGKEVTIAAFTRIMAKLSSDSTISADVQFLSVDGADPFALVGGNIDAKLALEESLCLESRKRKLLSSFDLSAPSGVLLYGPPGTGKTLLAKAVARMLRSRGSQASSIGGAFISLSISDIVLSEIGSSEKLVVSSFETARLNAPAVVFIDEFQALFTERSNSGSGRLSSTLLQCMDDIKHWRELDSKVSTNTEEENERRVVVLAATNTPWMIDSAFLRPGRFDRLVKVDLPSMEDRVAIMQLYMKGMKMEQNEEAYFIQNLAFQVAEVTEGFSGADLAALCRGAAIRCLMEGESNLGKLHFFGELDNGMTASSSTALVERISKWHP